MKHGNTMHQLFYYDPNRNFGSGDFSGSESILTEEDRRNYLKAYEKAARRWWGQDENNPEKAATEEEIENALRLCREAKHDNPVWIPIETADAFTAKHSSDYRDWHFYTDRVKVEKGALCFSDREIGPMGAAEWKTPKGESLREITVRFFVNADFAAPIRPYPLVTTTTGRVLELRKGTSDYIRFQIYTNGELHVKNPVETIYHPKNTCLKTDILGKEHELTVRMEEDRCAVFVDGEDCGSFPTLPSVPDTLFIHSGMQPHGNWRLTPVCARLSDGREIRDFFVPAEPKTEFSTSLGEVKLPYCIGTTAMKDMDLILEKKVVLNTKGKRTFFHYETVDPCGLVTLNGKTVAAPSDFLSGCVDVSEIVKDGENLLRVTVFPRAAEIFFTWHRHNDPLCGWFFGSCAFEQTEEVRISEIRAVTDFAENETAKYHINGKFDRNFKGSVVILRQKIHPTVESEEKLGVFAVNGSEFSYVFQRKTDLWDTDHPNLYRITLSVCNESGREITRRCEETGFRTIAQKDGEILLNGKRILMNGALIMQFLPPYPDVPKSHVCPTDRQIAMQYVYAKKMNCNTLRLHVLGYGTNDARFASYADRLGLLLLWTTRLIDIGETCQWNSPAVYGDAYRRQMSDVINHPSIAIWEASNEFHGDLVQNNRLYDDFVKIVREIDSTRLISPCSHLYYGGGIYDMGCNYYQDNGEEDENFQPVKSGEGWKDPLVVRSSHTYSLLLGYGEDWKAMRLQSWKGQANLLQSRDHAYLITEFAVIGKQCPTTEGAKEFFNPKSYELGNESATLGFALNEDEWNLSQSLQAICATQGVRRMREEDVDGMMWCCLMSGANNASYLKPPIDFHGYRKLAFFALREAFAPSFAAIGGCATHLNEMSLTPELYSVETGKHLTVRLKLVDEDGETVFRTETDFCSVTGQRTILPQINIENLKSGYYSVETEVFEA